MADQELDLGDYALKNRKGLKAEADKKPKGKAGRKPKPPSERATRKVQVTLTPSEEKSLEEKAAELGMANGTFIKSILKRNKII